MGENARQSAEWGAADRREAPESAMTPHILPDESDEGASKRKDRQQIAEQENAVAHIRRTMGLWTMMVIILTVAKDG